MVIAFPYFFAQAIFWLINSLSINGLTPSCTRTKSLSLILFSRFSIQQSPKKIDSCPVSPPGITFFTFFI